ncbi:hypothetical protein CYLTODRAFT_489199 [Cylindrobasidium torrendii FP15055 ss-10]|uniref:Uncharacterized protein n=1 Tax=Cylindrobasidium torrendii FP15055 ss-10 TaxID=1314674 RepID=A0A0D7BG57_9AGAR|nr:hypothetical protein CYLTODRAFT_489199 [Cylindrobasidium torrendii FP15055 ss-10]
MNCPDLVPDSEDEGQPMMQHMPDPKAANASTISDFTAPNQSNLEVISSSSSRPSNTSNSRPKPRPAWNKKPTDAPSSITDVSTVVTIADRAKMRQRNTQKQFSSSTHVPDDFANDELDSLKFDASGSRKLPTPSASFDSTIARTLTSPVRSSPHSKDGAVGAPGSAQHAEQEASQFFAGSSASLRHLTPSPPSPPPKKKPSKSKKPTTEDDDFPAILDAEIPPAKSKSKRRNIDDEEFDASGDGEKKKAKPRKKDQGGEKAAKPKAKAKSKAKGKAKANTPPPPEVIDIESDDELDLLQGNLPIPVPASTDAPPPRDITPPSKTPNPSPPLPELPSSSHGANKSAPSAKRKTPDDDEDAEEPQRKKKRDSKKVGAKAKAKAKQMTVVSDDEDEPEPEPAPERRSPSAEARQHSPPPPPKSKAGPPRAPSTAGTSRPSISEQYTVAPRTKHVSMSELIKRANSHPSSPFAGSKRPTYSPYAKSSRSFLSRIAPLHPNRKDPPPPLPKPPPRQKTKKEKEMEEQWEEELVDSVGGMHEWVMMSDAERAAMRKAKREKETSGWED